MNRVSLTAIIYVFLLSPHVHAETPTSCRAQELQKDQVESVVKRRATTFKHCLICQGQTCQLKKWPASGADFAQMCKVLFCTPKKIPRSAITPEEANQDGAFKFAYVIGKNGRVKDIKITEVSGAVTPELALKLANSAHKRRKYEPIVIDGKSYELSNLTDSIRFKTQ